MEKLTSNKNFDLKKLFSRGAVILALTAAPVAPSFASQVPRENSISSKKSPILSTGGESAIFKSKSGKTYLVSTVCNRGKCYTAVASLEGPDSFGLYEVGESLSEEEAQKVLLKKKQVKIKFMDLITFNPSKMSHPEEAEKNQSPIKEIVFDVREHLSLDFEPQKFWDEDTGIELD